MTHLLFLPDETDPRLFLWGDTSESALERMPGVAALAACGGPSTARLVDRSLRIADVSGTAVGLRDALPALAALSDDDLAGASASVAAWSLAAKLALDLVSRERLVPRVRRTPAGATEARWGVALALGEDAERVRTLAEAFPPAAHAVPVEAPPSPGRRRLRTAASRRSGPDGVAVWAPEPLLRTFLDLCADTIVRSATTDASAGKVEPSASWERRFVAALTSRVASFAPSGFRERALLDDLESWARPALGADPHAPRGCLRLELPVEGDEPDERAPRGSFPLRYFLQAPRDPSLLVSARDIWGRQSALRRLGPTFAASDEHLLRSLAVAARIFPPIARSLRDAHPTAVLLEPAEAWGFIADAAAALVEAGIGVIVPAELTRSGQRRLRLRLRVGGATAVKGAVPGAGGLGLDALVDFRWEAAIGGEVLSAAELATLARLKAPLVRWRGRWVAVDHAELADLRDRLAAGGRLPVAQALRAALAGEARADGTPLAAEVVADGAFAGLVERLRAGARVVAASAAPGLVGTLRDYQERGTDWLATMATYGLGACLADDMGLGKAQPLDARILTPTGWTTMGDLRVGDHVIGVDGQPTEVIGVYPQGEKDIYRVTFSDGSSTECCDDHLWTVNSALRRSRSAPARTLPLRGIRARLTDGAGNRQHFIPLVQPVNFEPSDITPLDPYLLGALLGDGGLTHTVVFTTADAEMVGRLAERLPEGSTIERRGRYDYRIIGTASRSTPNPVTVALRQLGLMGKRSEQKSVPRGYLIAPTATRRAVLQGLLDTDGGISQDGHIDLSSASRQLAEDVLFLVRSLGGTGRIAVHRTKHLPSYRVGISLPNTETPFRLIRKAARAKPRTKYHPTRAMVSVEHVGRKAAQCIAVASQQQLYVTDDFIVTHNTIQILAYLLWRRTAAADDRRPSLVVCPTSVVGNWEREIARFAPSLPVVRHYGSVRARSADALRSVPGGVVLTTYGLLRLDAAVLGAVDWDVAVLDEAQNIKNAASRTARAARALQATHRLALTGTPVENRLAELWSILEFTDPGLLGPLEAFRRDFAVPIERYRDAQAAERLRRIVGPFVLRRLKSDPAVIRDLPPKQELKVVCSLTREQATLYQAAVDEALREIRDTAGIQRRGRVLALLTALKQICDHPAHYLGEPGPLEGRSGKLARLTEMLEEVVAAGERALVFTQFREMGERLVAHLERSLATEVPFLHGGVARAARDAMTRRFQEDERGPRVFVLSLRAGGTGLNLTAASHVFHFDRWWNPAVEDQATDRAYRIGQRRAVQVHALLAAGTVEEKVDRMLEQKRDLAARVVGAGERWITELDDASLRDLLALSADAVVTADAPDREAAAASGSRGAPRPPLRPVRGRRAAPVGASQ